MPEIKNILEKDNPIAWIETAQDSGLEEKDLFKEKKKEFYQAAEKVELEQLKINVETIDWNNLKASAEDILKSIYMMTCSEYIQDKSEFSSIENVVFPLSNWHKFVNCRIHNNSETILRLKCFMASQQMDIWSYENWNPLVDCTFTKQNITNIKKKKELKLRDNEDKVSRSKLYLTTDWNLRYYHNPSMPYTLDWWNVHYSVWATESPYFDLPTMKEETSIPKSLWATDFFTNYMNAKDQTEKIIKDPQTGYTYCDPNDKQYNPPINEVSIEWDNHWNIQRFVLQPHFQFYSNVSKEKWKINALYDLYKYYLYIESQNNAEEKTIRESARNKANNLYTDYIEPIVNSKFEERFHENYYTIRNSIYPDWKLKRIDSKYFISPYNLYNSNNDTNFTEEILEYNQKIFLGEVVWKPYTRKEIEDILIDYNRCFRRKSFDEAKFITEKSLEDPLKEYEKIINEYKNKPLQEYKIIQEWKYPEKFNLRDPTIQDARYKDNPDKIKIVQESFTEWDRERAIKYRSNFKYAD